MGWSGWGFSLPPKTISNKIFQIRIFGKVNQSLPKIRGINAAEIQPDLQGDSISCKVAPLSRDYERSICGGTRV